MTYSTGSLVQAATFNGFANTNTPNINEVWGTGSGSSGYGQTAVPSVSVGDSITAAQWASLYNAVNHAAQHQNVALNHVGMLPLPVAGQTVTYSSALATDIQSVYDGRLNCLNSGTDIVASATRTAPWGGGVGIPQILSTITWTFDSYDMMRYYFNCGGRLRITASSAVGSSTPDDLLWNSFCSGMGVLALPAVSTLQHITNSDYNGLTQFNNTITPTIYTRKGFYDLTASPQQWFQQVNGGVYGSDNISINYSTTGSTVIATIIFEDTNNATIDGALSVYAVARPGESTYITKSWGTPVISVAVPLTLSSGGSHSA